MDQMKELNGLKNTLEKREKEKKDLLASNPHHTYFSDQPNINFSNGKINVNPGGLDSSEPELDPGTAFGRQAACTGRERGEKRAAEALREGMEMSTSACP